MNLKLKKIAVATAAAIAFGGAGQVQSSELLFPYVVVSPSVTTIVSVVNRNRYLTGDREELHHAVFWKTTEGGACDYMDRDLPTSENDIQSYDLAGRMPAHQRGVVYQDPSVNNDWQRANQNFALLNHVADGARGYLVVDDVARTPLTRNSRPITRVIGGTGTDTIHVTPNEASAFLVLWQNWVNDNTNLPVTGDRPPFQGVRVPVYVDVMIERELELANQGAELNSAVAALLGVPVNTALTEAQIRNWYNNTTDGLQNPYSAGTTTSAQRRGAFTEHSLAAGMAGFTPERIVLANNSLSGEALIVELGSGAAWGYQASGIMSGVAVRPNNIINEWIPRDYAVGSDAFLPGDLNAASNDVFVDHRSAAAGLSVGPFPAAVPTGHRWVYAMPIMPYTDVPSVTETAFFVTPLRENMRDSAAAIGSPGTVTMRFGPVGPGGTAVYDRDEGPFSLNASVNSSGCVSRIAVRNMIPNAVLSQIRSSGSDIGWGYLAMTTSNMQNIAASVIKLEYSEGGDFLGETLRPWNNSYQLQDARLTSANSRIGDRQLGRNLTFATPAEVARADDEATPAEFGLKQNASGLWVRAAS